MKSLSRVWLFTTPWTVAYQAPPSIEFSRQEYWSGFHFLFQRIFPTQGSNPGLLHCRQMLYCLSHQGSLFSDIWFANIFSHTVGCFTILLISKSFHVVLLFLKIWLQGMWDLNSPTRDWTRALEDRSPNNRWTTGQGPIPTYLFSLLLFALWATRAGNHCEDQCQGAFPSVFSSRSFIS